MVKLPVWKCYHARTKHSFPLRISFNKLVNAAAKGKQLRTQTSQNRFFSSNESKPEFNKLMKWNTSPYLDLFYILVKSRSRQPWVSTALQYGQNNLKRASKIHHTNPHDQLLFHQPIHFSLAKLEKHFSTQLQKLSNAITQKGWSSPSLFKLHTSLAKYVCDGLTPTFIWPAVN